MFVAHSSSTMGQTVQLIPFLDKMKEDFNSFACKNKFANSTNLVRSIFLESDNCRFKLSNASMCIFTLFKKVLHFMSPHKPSLYVFHETLEFISMLIENTDGSFLHSLMAD